MMKSLLAAAAVAALFAAPAFANEEAAVAPAAAPAVEAPAAAKEVMLKDGTKVEIVGDVASVVGADGMKTVAPDGEHELADGTKLTVKEGKVVAPAAPVEATPVEAPAAH